MNFLKKIMKLRILNAVYIILCVIKTLVSSAYPFANIVIPMLIIDELLAEQNLSRLALWVALLVGINLIYKVFISYLDSLIQKKVSSMNMQFDYFISEISMNLPYDILETDKVIQLIKQVKEGKDRAGGITSLVDSSFALISNIITTIGIIVLIASVDFLLIVLAVITILINTWVQSKLKKHDMDFFGVLMKHNTKFMYLVGVILNRRYAKDIRLYEANRTFTTKMDEFALDVDSWFQKIGRKKTKYSMLAHFADCLSQALIYGFLAIRFLSGSITVGVFTMYINAVTTFTNTIVNSMKTILEIYEKQKFLKPSFDYIEYEKYITVTIKNSMINISQNPVIEFKNVSYRYENSDTYALKNVSLTIPYGQKLSIVGMNGAGKTTLIKLLLRLYIPTTGEILIDGCNINQYTLDEYYKLFSVVFQDFKLLASTIIENIICAETDSKQEKKLIESSMKSGIYDRIEKMPLKYETQLYKIFDPEGVDLSGGEEQRLAISRSLYKSTPVVILDEPTASLDPKTEYDIYTGMDRLVEGKTSLYISHRMTSCIFCDMVAVFHEGELIQYGSHKQLISQDNLYAQMFNTQAQYYL